MKETKKRGGSLSESPLFFLNDLSVKLAEESGRC